MTDLTTEEWSELVQSPDEAVDILRAALIGQFEEAQTPLRGNEPPWMRKNVIQCRKVVAAFRLLFETTPKRGSAS